MKFKKGKLYRVVKYWHPGCIGCILRYEGTNKTRYYKGKPIKPTRTCTPYDETYCSAFENMISAPNQNKLVEYEDMVKFCKKLRSKREKENKV